MIVTASTASILTLLYIKLAGNVIRLRKQNQVSLGSGGMDELERAIRPHGNFSEYVPLSLILMGTLEYNGASSWLLGVLALMVIAGRVLHANGILTAQPDFKNRVRGMMLTFGALGLLALSNLISVVLKLIA